MCKLVGFTSQGVVWRFVGAVDWGSRLQVCSFPSRSAHCDVVDWLQPSLICLVSSVHGKAK